MIENKEMAHLARMNGLGNKILVIDMRGRTDKVTPDAAIRLNAHPDTAFDQIMALYDPRDNAPDGWIDILNSDGSMAQACGNGTRICRSCDEHQTEHCNKFKTNLHVN